MGTRNFSWGKGGRCFWLTYHPCGAESREPGTPRATSAYREMPLLYFILLSLTLLYGTDVPLLTPVLCNMTVVLRNPTQTEFGVVFV
jgi:hypothetical protein